MWDGHEHWAPAPLVNGFGELGLVKCYNVRVVRDVIEHIENWPCLSD